MMAANLNRDYFEVSYFYCDAAPYIGSDFKHATTDITRLKFLVNSNVNLVKFHVGAKDITREDHLWIESNFWELFNELDFDLVVTGKAGSAEYPYTEISLPVIEYVTLGAGVDKTESIKWSIHCSEWQRRRWIRMGGDPSGSSTLPIPFFDTRSEDNYRLELEIPNSAFVIGMHQRVDDGIYSSIPLSAFESLSDENSYFLVLGGSSLYADQAKRLGIENFIQLPHAADEELISKFLNTLNVFSHGRSDGETFGTVFAEAMSHGLPVVTHFSKDGANAQSETIGPAGKCVENKEQYANFLRELKSDLFLSKKFSEKAQDFSESNYSLASVSRQFENIIFKVLGANKIDVLENALGFGRSPLGFLQFGELNNPSSTVHHIVNGIVPEEFNIFIASFFLRRSKVYYDIGSDSGLFSLLGAQINSSLEVHCFEIRSENTEQLQQSVYLNNWEDKIRIHKFFPHKEADVLVATNTLHSLMDLKPVKEPGSTLNDANAPELSFLNLNDPDLIKIDVDSGGCLFLNEIFETIISNNPVILLRLTNNIASHEDATEDFARTLDLMFELNYSVYKIDAKGSFKRFRDGNKCNGGLMYVCIPQLYKASSLPTIRLQLFRHRTKVHYIRNFRTLRSKVGRLVRKFGI